jgi:1-aminocyclopropane-1-carboxylate deaminase/D-cysteine desulfhydrase-like pyridoxal-dependent ACC family enzyme
MLTATIDDVLDRHACTPVQACGEYLLKRDDAFVLDGSRGGKVRACLAIVADAQMRRPPLLRVAGLTTAGSRQSPQVNIVATVAQHLGIPCRVHVPAAAGPLTPELEAAVAHGAEIVQHRPGYNSVIVARARTDASDMLGGHFGWLEIPFGMEHRCTIVATAAQARALPRTIGRLVVPVGSGMALAGIVEGTADRPDLQIIGVQVGADPTERLDRYAAGWRARVTLVAPDLDYHTHAPVTALHGVELDPVYEAKCLPYLEPGDCLWVVGCRATHGKDS